ncbi:MAG: amidohydrolase [Firmicutes bacterium]|nr:amidohydrolase [Bacillota bacterium]
MLGKIGLEEHFAIEETLGPSMGFASARVGFKEKLLDLLEIRLDLMDKYGMDMMILSLNSPAIQAIYNKQEAIDVAKKANDIMANAFAQKPNRFRGFAALPMQDPDAAIEELHRAVDELGCVGVLVNGFSQIDDKDNIVYLDDPRYRPFWAELEKSGKPFYLHPRKMHPKHAGLIDGHPWLDGATWGFTVETATHALRLLSCGIFDEYPDLKILIGHLGETLPFLVGRIDNRMNIVRKAGFGPPAQKPFYEYMAKNVWLTTSGQFQTAPLLATMMEFGSDKIMFATDWPFEEVQEACEWFDACPISELDRQKIGRDNAIKFFGLDL